MVNYRSCAVPLCKNSTIKTPEKIFFFMPRDPVRRKKWCSVMGRNLGSEKSSLYVCEDHFDIEKDMDNYIRYKLQGVRVRIKKDSLPHIFHCQNQKPVKAPSTVRKLKREQKKIVEELSLLFAPDTTPEPAADRPFTPTDNVVLRMDSFSTLQVENESLHHSQRGLPLPMVTTPSEAISLARRKPIPKMVGCSAVGCKNKPEEGYQMKIFPKDLKRRKLWISNVNRQNWEPTKYSSLCEVHFDEDQWENSTDKYGRKIRIIKKDAVPTIFSYSPNMISSPTLDCHSDAHEEAKLYNDLDKGKENKQNPDSTVLSIVMDLEIENDQKYLLTLLSNDLDIKVRNEENPNLTILSKESDLEVENKQKPNLTVLSNDLDPVKGNELKPDSTKTSDFSQEINKWGKA